MPTRSLVDRMVGVRHLRGTGDRVRLVDELVDLPHQDAEGQHRGGRGNRGDHVVEERARRRRRPCR